MKTLFGSIQYLDTREAYKQNHLSNESHLAARSLILVWPRVHSHMANIYGPPAAEHGMSLGAAI